jgi:glycosyltransferase involved in cell wall biosynthesis
MRSVLFISMMNGTAWGGSEELWYRAALYAANNGYQVACALYEWEEKQKKIAELESHGIKVYRLPNKGRKKENFFQKWQYKLVTKLKLAAYVRHLPVEDYDCVVMSQGGFEVAEKPWKHLYKRLHNYALLFHNYNEHQQFKPAKAHLLKQWVQNASVNLVAAGRIQTVLEEKLQIAMPNTEVLRNPITFLPPGAVTPYPSLQPAPIFVILAALEVDRKAQDHLIKALAAPQWKERAWQLHLYGKGKDKRMLQSLIEQHQLEDKIFLKGHTTDVKACLQKAHLVLQITHIDAMPLSVVEAMAMSRPVIVSPVGDMPEWINDEVNGWISKDASTEAITAVLEKAWQNKNRWKEMGEQSFALFKQEYPVQPEAYFLQQLSF